MLQFALYAYDWSNLHIEDTLGLKTSIMEVKILVPSSERSAITRVIKALRNLLAKLFSGITFLKHRFSQFHLLLHKILNLIGIRILKPCQKTKNIKTEFNKTISTLSPNKTIVIEFNEFSK